MSRKKPQKPKKVENDIDINNIDVMFEDMKNLVLNSENTTDTIDNIEEKENVKEASFDTNLTNGNTTLIETETQETNDIVEMLNETEENGEVVSVNEETDVQQIEEQQTEELVQEEEIKEEPKKENKSKRMTYEEMFGHTWMGYGFSY